MNPLTALKTIQQAYLTYLHTFQKFNNPAIQDWVAERVEQDTLPWRDPYIQLSRRFQKGESFDPTRTNPTPPLATPYLQSPISNLRSSISLHHCLLFAISYPRLAGPWLLPASVSPPRPQG